jgi:alkylation response protein AidB-like acyl-CoA dehydrogenase
MTIQSQHEERFPIPADCVGEEGDLLARSVARWADEEVIAARHGHGEDHEALLAPALRRLMVEVGLRDLLWPDGDEAGGGGEGGEGEGGVGEGEAGAESDTGDAGDAGELARASTCAAVLEQVGRADTGLALQVATTWALQRRVPAALQPHLSERGDAAALVLPGYGGQRPGEPPHEGSAAERAAHQAPGAGLHGLRAQVTARPRGDRWVLEGREVRPLGSGLDAGCFGVIAEVGGAVGDKEGGADGDGAAQGAPRGPALFAVPGAAAGLSRGAALRQTGLRGCRNTDLQLEGVALQAGFCLAAGPEGAQALRELWSWTLLGSAAAGTGALLAAHTILDDWADSRVIKGKGQHFKDNPLVGALLGDVGGEIAASRLLLYGLARLMEPGRGSGAGSDARAGDGARAGGGAGAGAGAGGGFAGSAAGLATATTVARRVLRSAMDALDWTMELMASAGYATEWQLERYWRDVKTLSAATGLETAGRLDQARHYFGCENL